jgi:hypothetical protein
MAMVVMMMGRARSAPAWTRAVARAMPWRRFSMTKSTSRMLFLVTMLISMRMPMTEERSSAAP